MLKDYGTDVQKLFLEMMLQDAESYIRVQNIYNPENFDRSLRPAAEFIKKHVNEFKTMPALSQVNAVTGLKLNNDYTFNEDQLNWFMSEFEAFT